MGTDLLSVAEEIRLFGKISGSMNSTFLVLIPKSDKASSFGDFRPIALRNSVYKLFSKIIAERLKEIMGKIKGNHG